jgi:hypothetical protein
MILDMKMKSKTSLETRGEKKVSLINFENVNMIVS